ncbi:MAG: hypothetical protein BWY57_00912 [Betaproteobacteria bacterium ADurb.Bin341]|nr:MAG: hypothetical protein BWY57_00912 [Betaproteobacteria bacterium ADurb.Bin341]
MNQVQVGVRDHRILTHGPKQLDLPSQGRIENTEEAVILGGAFFRQPAEAEVIAWLCVFAKPGLKSIHCKFGPECTVFPGPLLERRFVSARVIEIAKHKPVEYRHVASPLDTRLTAQGIHTATRFADIPEQELQNAVAADVLNANGVLRHTERVENRARTMLGVGFGDIPDLLDRNTGDLRTHLQGIALEEGSHLRENSTRIIKTIGHQGLTRLFVKLIRPCSGIVALFVGLITCKQALLKAKIVA